MIGWMVSVAMTYASPCPDAFDETVAQLVQRGDVQAYGCAVAWSGDDQAFVEQIRKGDERANPRLRRTLLFRLLDKHDKAWDAEIVALLSAADRRMLADGVRARRGRKSPSELHHQIFLQ